MIFQLVAILFVLLLLILSISKWKMHPFMALILAGLILGLLMGMDGKETVNVLLNGFGSTLKWIAIVVILGAFIGEVLHDTGGAIRISDKVLKSVGMKKLPWAMGVTGYIVSIPVFVDVAYILFQPITEALAKRSKTPVLVVGLALTAGLTVSHTLMPPTPRTRPRKVISPVMATSLRVGVPVSAEMSATAIVIPADGPSLGVAPSGMWMWMSTLW